jgi:hypothetical protein
MFDELSILLDVANTMKQYDINQQSTSYKKIIKQVDYRIFELCQHCIVEDCIDTDIDNCCNIKYCSKCLLTFNIQFIFSYLQYSLENIDSTQWTLHHNNNVYFIQKYWVQNNRICFSIVLKKDRETISFDLKKLNHIQCVNGKVLIK